MSLSWGQVTVSAVVIAFCVVVFAREALEQRYAERYAKRDGYHHTKLERTGGRLDACPCRECLSKRRVKKADRDLHNE